MAKKFFDIIPPDKIEERQEVQEIQEKRERPVLPEKIKKGKKLFLKSSIFLVVSLILVLLFGFFFFPNAQIEIKPKKFTITIKDSVAINLLAENYSFEDKIIPGSISEDERTLERDFVATGKTIAEKKATGKIVVYNEYSASPRTLVSSRFVSADGKLFWSTETITIPGYKKEGSRIIPGEKEVTVQAAEAGEDYNIGSTTFALPALAGSALYTTIYAKSFSPMSGGEIGEVLQITKQDLENAEDFLVKEAKDLGKEALSARLPVGFILLDETISQEILNVQTSVEEKDLLDSFKYKAEIKSSGFSFKKEYLDDFIKSLIDLNLKEDEKFLENQLKTSYSLQRVDLEEGKLILEIVIEAQIYKDINIEELKRALLGKTKTEAEMLLRSLDSISEFNLKNKPFLKKRLPEDIDKIQVILSLD